MLISFPSLAYLVSQSALTSSVIDFNQQSSPAVLNPSAILNTMADMNIPVNDVPAEQAPAIAPPTRTDDQILPLRK
ncbi:hypothetical protein Tco_0550171 [Tanacetum coccineum]